MENRKRISPKGEEILFFLEWYIQKNGYPPTVREIGEAVGLASSCSVHYHLRKLEEQNLIRRTPGKPRAIELNVHQMNFQLEKEVVFLPFLDKLSFTKRGLEVGNAEKFFLFSRSLLEDEECFVFRVRDDKFQGWNILPGDYLIVAKKDSGCAGSLMLVWEGEKVGVRKVGENGRLMMEPESSSPWDASMVVGKIVGVWRKL